MSDGYICVQAIFGLGWPCDFRDARCEIHLEGCQGHLPRLVLRVAGTGTQMPRSFQPVLYTLAGYSGRYTLILVKYHKLL